MNFLMGSGIGSGGKSSDVKITENPSKPNCVAVKKPKFLGLHGWRTSGQILSVQTASLRLHTKIDCSFIDAPYPALGEPAKGVAMYYPNMPYFEWCRPVREIFSENYEDEAPGNNNELEVSITKILDFMKTNGPFDGLLGFSQG